MQILISDRNILARNIFQIFTITLCSSEKCSTDALSSIKTSFRRISSSLHDLIQVRLAGRGHLLLWSLGWLGPSPHWHSSRQRNHGDSSEDVGRVQWMSSLMISLGWSGGVGFSALSRCLMMKELGIWSWYWITTKTTFTLTRDYVHDWSSWSSTLDADASSHSLPVERHCWGGLRSKIQLPCCIAVNIL